LDKLSDEKLVILYLKGKKEAFDELTERYVEEVHRFSLYLTKNVEAAKDLTQDTFLKLISRLRNLRDPKKVRPFIFNVTGNLYKESFRKKRREKRREKIYSEMLDDNKNPNANIDEIAEEVEVYLRLLPNDNKIRDCFIFRHTRGWTIEKIAEYFNLTENQVRYRLKQALEIYEDYFKKTE